MNLIVTTPTEIVLEKDEVEHVRAEDETGAFGILPGHADFLTVLVISVLSWRDKSGREGHVALRGGTLQVRDGVEITVATREAISDEDLDNLETRVLSKFRQDVERQELARKTGAALELAAIRRIREYLYPDERGAHRAAASVAAGAESKGAPSS